MYKNIDFEEIVAPALTEEHKIEYNNAFSTIRTFSGEEFESLVLEWLKYGKNALSPSSFIARVGGTGDKGIDIYYAKDGLTYYYQCKQYNQQLTLPEVEEIIVKILWHSFLKEIPEPTNIFIIAANSVNIKAAKMLSEISALKDDVIENLEKILLRFVIEKPDPDFALYVNSINFDIVKKIDIEEIIKSYYNSEYGKLRFKAAPKRIKRVEITQENYADEEFHKQLLEIAPKEHQLSILNTAKGNYYSALCLKETDKYLFGNNVEFERLKEEIFQTIESLTYSTYSNDLERYSRIILESAKANTSFSLLDRELNIVENSDKKGVCHILVNENKIVWSTK